jgi:hypothetical protein
MPITTHWYDEDHYVIAQKFDGNWTWDEMVKSLEEIEQMSASVSHNVIIFNDMSDTKVTPKGNTLIQGRACVRRWPKNVTQIVLVLHSRIIEVFVSLVFEIAPGWRDRVVFAHNYADGQQLVEKALAKNHIATSRT